MLRAEPLPPLFFLSAIRRAEPCPSQPGSGVAGVFAGHQGWFPPGRRGVVQRKVPLFFLSAVYLLVEGEGVCDALEQVRALGDEGPDGERVSVSVR